MKLKSALLAVGLSFSALGCGHGQKLNITELCILNPDGTADCFYLDNTSKKKSGAELDQYTAFNPENAQKINSYITKCLKAGVRP